MFLFLFFARNGNGKGGRENKIDITGYRERNILVGNISITIGNTDTCNHFKHLARHNHYSHAYSIHHTPTIQATQVVKFEIKKIPHIPHGRHGSSIQQSTSKPVAIAKSTVIDSNQQIQITSTAIAKSLHIHTQAHDSRKPGTLVHVEGTQTIGLQPMDFFITVCNIFILQVVAIRQQTTDSSNFLCD